MMRVIGEKGTLAGLLETELHLREQDTTSLRPTVKIGRESGIPELAGLSLITTIYKKDDKIVGVLGILGSKRMEYSRMMSLVDYLSDLVSRRLMVWEKGEGQ